MVCGCPHCKAEIPASTPGGMCLVCVANCEEHLNAIAQIHASPTILPKAPEAMTTAKMFPILMYPTERARHPTLPRSIPWEMVAPYEDACQRNHQQSVETLAKRGGLCPEELYWIWNGYRYGGRGDDHASKITTAEAVAFLVGRISSDLKPTK